MLIEFRDAGVMPQVRSSAVVADIQYTLYYTCQTVDILNFLRSLLVSFRWPSIRSPLRMHQSPMFSILFYVYHIP